MRSFVVLALVAVAATCGPDPNAKLPGSAHSAGGQSNEGGTTESGGTTTDNGGAVGSGGVVGTGGKVVGSGGKVGTGGRVGSGGAAGGGRDAGSSPRDTGAGGAVENGGAVGSGGRIGSGGSFGRNDAAIVGRDTAIAGPEVAGGCISAVVANDYACGSASCADCKDNNGNSREAGCQKAIDCIAEKGAACDTNCENNCRNLAGDSYGQTCVTALKTAACSTGGCGATVGPRG